MPSICRNNFHRRFRKHAQRAALTFMFLSSLLTGASAQQSRPARRAARTSAPRKAAAAKRATGLNIGRINDPANRTPVGPHSQGDAVVRAAILVDRLKFSPGEIQAAYTVNLSKAVSAFQMRAGLPVTGNVDPATWAALNDSQMPATPAQPQPSQQNSSDNVAENQPPQPQSVPAIITYILTPEDVTGPFTKLPVVAGRDAVTRRMLREARLTRLNYESPLQLVSEKFHASPRLLTALNPKKLFRKPGEQIQVPNVLTPEPPQASSVVVDGSNRSVTAFDGNGKVLAFYPATVGSEHDPLPVGMWNITEISWYPKFKYNPELFWDAENKNPRATIAPGPKNPVGVVWIGLSKAHYGIHGTPEPSKIGLTESHGCIRLTNWDATELGKMVHVGTSAILKNDASQDSAPANTHAESQSVPHR
jgi:lipoprotein-anchoring transpeptidase ErfK/SrfK